MKLLKPEFAPIFECLFRPARYIVLYGGRGSGKSWAVARSLLIRAVSGKLRILCAREVQNSIQESVKKLLVDQIDLLGLGELFEIQRDLIRCPSTGSEFFFEGLKHNVSRIKSYEGIDICWVEEAHAVSEDSWRVLTPTIRKPDSQIIVTFNPQLESDATFVRFVKRRPTDAVVVKVNWTQNPWFPEDLHQEMDDMKRDDYDAWLNVWEGHCKSILSGAVYAKELREALALGRIGAVPYDRTQPVHTFWDLGWADKTSIWFAQIIGFEYRVIDYYENSQQGLDHYLKALQTKDYSYGDLWLPHDAKAKQLGTGRSVEELVRAKGNWRVRIVPRLKLEDGINAARTLFPLCYFDELKCEVGLKALKSYRYEVFGDVIENQSLSRAPLHDWASHAADAFRYLTIGLRLPKQKGKVRQLVEESADFIDTLFGTKAPRIPETQGWMR